MTKLIPLQLSSPLRRRSVLKGGTAGLTVLAMPWSVVAQTADEILVGAIMPLSGAGGSFGQEMLAAAKIALEEINAAGGPLGRPIRLIEENDETNPEQAVRAARKLVDVDKVNAIVGTWASSVTLAVAPISQATGIVQFSTSGSSRITEVQKNGFVFRTEPDDLLFGKAYAEYAIKQGWTKAAVLGLNVPFTETTVAAFQERFEAKGGSITSYTTYNEEQTTFRTEVLRAFADQPDIIHISGYEPDITAILKAAYQAGQQGRFIVPGFAVSQALIDGAGPAAEGLMLVEEGVAEGSPAYDRLAKGLGEGRYYSFGAQAYDHMNLLALAIEAAGTTDGARLNDTVKAISGPGGSKVSSFAEGAEKLRAGEDIDYEGASGPIDFDADGNIVRANFRISSVQSGKITPIDFLQDVVF